MIRISRDEDTPQALVDDGAAELQTALDHYDLSEDERDPRYLPSSFFKAYKADGVKPTLNKLFHKKCAYCETKARPSGYFAIEHFRPKASIKIEGSLEPPGYWWLAACWDNLIPACNQCNSSHKGNLFPISGIRATTPGSSLSAERRLLVHPCRDRPESHFEFRANGDVLGKSRKGRTSIQVYGLARIDLTSDRKAWITRAVKLQDKNTRKAVINHKEGNYNSTQLANEIRALIQLRDDEAEYAGASRQITAKTVSQVSTYLDIELGTDLDAFVKLHASPEPEEVETESNEDVNDVLDTLLADLTG